MRALVTATALVLAACLPAQTKWTKLGPTPTSTSPTARSDHAMAGNPATGIVTLFGGGGAGGWLADTWTWDRAAWQLAQPVVAPPARHRHAMAYDSDTGAVLLTGGSNASGCLGDSWIWDGSTWSGITFVPSARHLHAMAYDAARRRVVLFGGNDGTYLGDTWLWGPSTGWTALSPAVSPPARDNHAMAYDLVRHRVVLFGGSNGSLLNDTWEWDGTTWAERSPAQQPPGREGHGMAYLAGRGAVAMFGGIGAVSTWEWNGIDWVRLPGTGPFTRGGLGLSAHSATDLLMFGGYNSNGLLDDTWQLGLAGYLAFGNACGPVPPRLRAGGPPRIGRPFRIELSGLPTFRVGVLFTGASNRTWGALSLPASLTPVGAPGCTLYVSGESQVGFATFAHTNAAIAFTVPAIPALVGQRFFNQAFVVEPTANSLGIIATNAGEGTVLGPTNGVVVERFDDDDQLDAAASSGIWANGRAVPGAIGGTGVHGAFDITQGRLVGPNIWEWSTDNQAVGSSLALLGPAVVSDGVFYFSRFEVAAGQTLRWIGSRPTQLFVRGSVDIRGTVQLNAPQLAPHNRALPLGQAPGAGGPGGSRGGKGGDLASGLAALPAFSGGDGENVRLPAGHAYAAAAAGSGGGGSPQYPVDGLNSSVSYNGVSSVFSAQIAAGGGGGGFDAAGQNGTVVRTSNNTGEHGPDGVGGTALSLFPIPPSVQSLDHFSAGGAGGGGGGSHPFFSLRPTVSWRSGAAGAGGGGVLALRAGRDVAMAAGSSIEAQGGAGATLSVPPAAPGGGGSGGSVLVQCGAAADLQGTLDTRGGAGGSAVDNSIYFVEVRGGDGAAGAVRVEVPQSNPAVGVAGTTVPPATANTVGTLTDTDPWVGSQSLWYASGATTPPQWTRYEVDATVDGTPVTFSDDPAIGVLATTGQPLRFFVQGARVDPETGQPQAGTIRPWRTAAGIGLQNLNNDDATGFRFVLLFDRGVAQQIQVNEVRVLFRG